MPDKIEIQDIIAAVEEAAAFAEIMRETGYGDIESRNNGPNFATGADRAVESMLRSSLSRLDEGAGFVSEDDPRESRNGNNWIVDPIDGTGNFASDLDYAVSVAYEKDGEVLMGAVCCTGMGMTFYAEKGKGSRAAAIGSNMPEVLKLPKKRKDRGNLLFGMPRHPEKIARMLGTVASVADLFNDTKRMGPTSIDICRTVSGTACVYIGIEPEIWDIAAAGLVVSEAGGKVVRPEGTDIIIMGHGEFVDKMCAILGYEENA